MKKSIKRDGYVLQYTIEGEGTPTLVIGSALFYPKSFSHNLRNHLRMAFVDWRGFSPTEGSLENLSLDTILEDIDALRKEIGFEKCVVMGHSAHGLLALEYAKKFPQAVTHVVMIGISPNLNEQHHAAAVRNWEENGSPERKAALQKRIEELPDEALHTLPAGQRFVEWYVRRDPQAFYDYTYNSAHLWEGICPNMAQFDYLYGVALRDLDCTQGLSSFTKPIFLALGRYDYIVAPPSAWDPIMPHFHNATRTVFEKSGHSPQHEEQPLFDAALLHFLRK
ncbi:MAG: alpha/beta hydrolase [Verrucomicrobia bacterium]|nr:alpha/beta hydrolase [Verrucomicrobiota bacterium]MBS0637724.1 alpha/beta hydrolase [Verrucomicrobiota bacterium]